MLIRHSMVYMVAKGLPGLLGMATTAVLTRVLPPSQYGVYGLCLVVMTFGTAMLFDWLGVSFLRFYQARRNDPLVASTMVHLFLVLVALSAALALIGWAAGAFHGIGAAIAVGLAMMVAYSWFELAGRFEIANFRPARYLVMNTGRGLFAMAGACAAAVLTRSPLWTGVGTAAGTACGALLGGFTRWKLGRAHFDTALARSVLGFGLPIAASITLNNLVNAGTRTLTEVLGSAAALGLYTAAYMLVQNTLGIAASGIASASYSLSVRAVEGGDAVAIRRQLLANGEVVLAVLAPAAIGMALTAHGIARLMVGPPYVVVVAALTPWMAAAGFFGNFRAHYQDHAFQLGRRPMGQVWVTAVAAVVSLGLSVWLIPRLGPLGAAMGAAAGMAVSCVHAAITGRRAYPVPLPVAAGLRIAVACAAMAVAVRLAAGAGTVGLLMQVGAGVAAYGAACLALNVLETREAMVRLAGRLARLKDRPA